MLKVLHAIETMAPHEGGPPRVVAALTIAQRSIGVDAQIFCGDGAMLAHYLPYWEAHAPGFPGEVVHSVPASARNRAARAAALRRALRASVSRFDIVHIHQLWRLVPTLTGNVAGALDVPYLIAPHTSLSSWALAQSRWKKTLARHLVWNRIFKEAAGFHGLNALEAEEIRGSIGPSVPPVIVVPNGVSLAEFSGDDQPGVPPPFAQRLTPREGEKPFVLFLARLHVMKGPDLLVEAFDSVARAHPKVQLALAGPDFGMLDTLRRRVAQLNLSERVHFLGLVSGSDRLWLLRNALCLSQPSRDEGFSLSILEAMASSCPVVISDRCKFPEVALSGAGAVVPLRVPDLAAALSRYASDDARRRTDGEAGRRLVETSYSWDMVAHRTARMYETILGRALPATTRTVALP